MQPRMCPVTSLPSPRSAKRQRKAEPAKKRVRVATSMERRMSPQSPPLAPPSTTSSVHIDMKRANEHLEELRFWHETCKPKMTKEQIAWITNLQLQQQGARVPSLPIDMHDAIREIMGELDMAREIVQILVPDRSLFANTLV